MSNISKYKKRIMVHNKAYYKRIPNPCLFFTVPYLHCQEFKAIASRKKIVWQSPFLQLV